MISHLAPPTQRNELLAVCFLAWAGLLSIPLGLGEIGLAWDALNHHMYLGWTAFSPRFDRDFLAASYQSYTYPYLYWPAYKLAAMGVPGKWAGAVLVSLHVYVIPALWLLARALVPQKDWEGVFLRAGAVALALLGELSLSLLDVTMNDFAAAIPLVWSVTFGICALDGRHLPPWLSPSRALDFSGIAAGIAVAFKFSNGPVALVLPILWVLVPGSVPQRAWSVVRAGLWTWAAFLLFYGYWGWQLWERFGNPLYPFYDGWFAMLRTAADWRQP